MSKNDSGSGLLMPLAIGGGLLLLFLTMNKAKAGQNASTDMIPLDEEIPASGNIIPNTAPSYTELDDEEDTSAEEAAFAPNANRNQEEDSSSEENFDEKPITASTPTKRKIIGNGKPKMGTKPVKYGGRDATAEQNRKFAERNAQLMQQKKRASPLSLKQQSDQNRKLAADLLQQKKRTSPLSLRQQSDQNRKFAERGGMPVPIPISPSSASSKVFPLKFGQTNSYIKNVQQKLGVSNTGFFGALTKAALLKKYIVTEVSETLYQQILAAPTAPKKMSAPAKKVKKAPVKKKITKLIPKKKAKKK